mmetsp:Transcript_3317/g.7729  ORF Transcript_3317/g.7729 Transcript_3317/m.7729 type:complete len:104 (+) Transcript_3317:693-1004(+)
MAEASEGESDASVNGAAVDIGGHTEGCGDPLDRQRAGRRRGPFDMNKKAGGTADEDKENCQASGALRGPSRRSAGSARGTTSSWSRWTATASGTTGRRGCCHS